MTSGFRGDPSARRRRDADEVLRDAQEIVRRHLRGEHVRPIASALGLPRNTVHRVIQDYRRAQREVERDAEQAALLSKYSDTLSCEDVRSVEDVMALNDLERYRWDFLPRDHPAKRFVVDFAALEAAWMARCRERDSEREPTIRDWRNADADW